MIYTSEPKPRTARAVWRRIAAWLPAGYELRTLWWNGPRDCYALRWIFEAKNPRAHPAVSRMEGECHTNGAPSGYFPNERGSWTHC